MVRATLPMAAPMIVPAAPSVERRTADETAAKAPATVFSQSISRRGGLSVISASMTAT